MPALSILLDTAQQRIKEDGLSTLVTGRDWSPYAVDRSNVYVDPITNQAMLLPGPMDPQWPNSTSGIYSKYTKADFTLTDSANWVNMSADAGGPFAQYNGPTGNVADLQGIGPVQAVNQAMVAEWFNPGTTGNVRGVFECGYSNTGDGSVGVSFRVYLDGRTEVWKNGAYVGEGSISGKSVEYFDPKTGAIGQAPKNAYVTLMIIPCRDREVLLISSMGGGFCHIFEDLTEQLSGQTITDNAAFWFNVPAPGAATVRVAQIQYAASGFICGKPSAWRLKPPTDPPATLIYQALTQAAVGGLASASVQAPTYNPYSVPTDTAVQIKVSLVNGGNGTGNATPFIYGARAYYAPQLASTFAASGGGVEVLPYTTSFSFEIPDSLTGSRATANLNSTDAMATAGLTQITTQCNRPATISIDGLFMQTGICKAPHFKDADGWSSDVNDLNRELELQIQDVSKIAEDFQFSDPIPLDGLTLYDAYMTLAREMGVPANVSPSAMAFALPSAGSCSGGEFNLCVEVGDKGVEWLDRLHQTFAGTWWHGPKPDGSLNLIDPAYMPSGAAVTLYRSTAAAIAAGKPANLAPYYVYKDLAREILEPEANDIFVTGIDRRTGRPISGHYRDVASADPTVPAISRPANWLGGLRKYGWIDPFLTTMPAVQYALAQLKVRLPAVRSIYQFSCQYQPGVWRGDLINLDGIGPVRIKSLSGGSQVEATDGIDVIWRECRYVGESGPLACPLDVHGTSALQIAGQWRLKAYSKRRVFGDGMISARRPLLNQYEAA